MAEEQAQADQTAEAAVTDVAAGEDEQAGEPDQPRPADATQTQPPAATKPPPQELQRILKLEVPVIVKVAERKMRLSEILNLSTGSVIEFSKNADDNLELLVNNKPIGIGRAVKVGEKFGLRVLQIGDIRDTIRSLGEQR